MFHVKLFFHYFMQYLKIRMAYRSDFLVQLATDLLFQAVNLVFILVVFSHTTELSGWTREEVIFIYGYFLVPFSFFSAFFNLWDFNERYIIKGELDRVLTRPAHSLYQVILETMTPESLTGAVTGFMVMGWAVKEMEVDFSWYDPFLFILFVAGGAAIYAGIYILLTSISLYSDSKTDIQPIMYNVGNYGRYPINVYNRVIQLVLTWVIPFAFVGFYPASFLLDKERWMTFALLTPLVGAVWLMLGVAVWNRGIRNYRGAGN
ncbi:ABC-2 type transport system permease protein [Melghirimyces profundicolus]|uniref:ABC-2 type transport system permease protein n=1 Tax=Melghirimyces profundicolus TaxID=1242148 RepID=A0A2T6BXA7_9BACL|nr:ABC-2 family transporter protein [Melghirimyces profundicolus]PTX60711.1 ABC-2 type transport system permease protein [Melghirimyces profundicolus]